MDQINQNWKDMSREERGKLIVKSFKIIKTNNGWIVPSQQKEGQDYLVKFKDKPICECADCRIRKNKCKHIYAVEFYIKQEISKEGKVTETKGVKVSYSQQWKAYDKSQTNEKLMFLKLLKDLVSNVEQPTYNFGRPKLPMQDLIFASVLRVYSTFSLRRFMSDLKIAKEMNLVDKVPCYASIGHFLQDETLTEKLKQLIQISSLPLSSVEDSFCADSSGFSTTRFARYFDYKWGKESKYRIWIKAHLISGVKTNIVTGVEITQGREHDSPQLASLIEQTAKNFNLKEVSCDRAYSSRENLRLIKEAGATPFIPFKSNTTSKNRGTSLWGKMYYYFLYKHDEFLKYYHKRSNAETVFHMIKTKFKDSLRSKDKTAQVNELLCKIICHNICVVIQEINELGVSGNFVVEK